MSGLQAESNVADGGRWGGWIAGLETVLLVLLFFVAAGDPPPAINEAHYLVLAKNFWQPDWCAGDLFVTSDKPHVLFHATFGALTQVCSLATAAWVGRLIAWTMLAVALQSLTRSVCDRRFASLAVAVIWIAGVEWFNLAGEWVIGGIEAKVPAYAFVVAAMTQMATGKWTRVWPLLGIASAFHVLVGGWTVVAAMFAYAIAGRHRSPLAKQIMPLLLGGAIAMLGLWPALRMSAATDPVDAIAAAKYYTYSRIAHHLMPSSFPAQWYVRHGVIVVVTFAAAWPLRRDRRFAPLFWLAVGSCAIALGGLILGMLPRFAPDLGAQLLRFYWFRATDSITPLTLGLAIAVCLRSESWLREPAREPAAAAEDHADDGQEPSGLRRASSLLIIGTAVALLGISTWRNLRYGIPVSTRFDTVTYRSQESIAAQQQAYRDWVAVCRWVDQSLPADEILITPRHQYTFKWYAQRAEVVNWKDVPQDADSLVQWYRRFFEIYPRRLGTVRVTIRYPELRRFREQYGARFMIVDRRVVGPNLPLVLVYPQREAETNATYAVYRLP